MIIKIILSKLSNRITLFEAIPATLGVILSLICIYLVYSKSSKPLYNIPRLIIISLIADIVIMICLYLMLGIDLENDTTALAIYMSVLSLSNLALMITGSSAISLLVYPKISRTRTTVYSSLVGFTLASSLALILGDRGGNKNTIDTFTLILSWIILLSLIIWAVFSIKDLKKAYFHGKIGIPSRTSPWMIYVMIVVLLIISVILITILQGLKTNNIVITLNAIVLAIMARYFYHEDRLIFLFPSTHNLLLIADYHGNLKYSYNFALLPVGESRENLLAGWLTSISHILSEFFDQTVKPKEIKLDENRIYLNWADHYLMAFITDQQSALYLQALHQLGHNLDKKFGLQVELLFSNSRYLDLKDIVEASFDFI